MWRKQCHKQLVISTKANLKRCLDKYCKSSFKTVSKVKFKQKICIVTKNYETTNLNLKPILHF